MNESEHSSVLDAISATGLDGAAAAGHPLTRLQSLLITVGDLTDFLTELTKLSAELVPGVSCGITSRRDGQPLTVSSSDDRAALLDETQYEGGEGPCLQTLQTGEMVSVPDMTGEGRWPIYTKAALQQGLRCSLSLPLASPEQTLGAMNFYGFDRPGMFDGAERQPYEVFAGQAAGALQIAALRHRDAELVNQLETALTSRSVIDQAIGVLMAQQRCTAEVAFDLLRAHSQNSQRKIRDLAADLVTRVSGHPPEPGHPFAR
jgi:GAF domain-containing protein